MVGKDLLQDIHKTIIGRLKEEENPHPSRLRGRGVDVSQTLFYCIRHILCPLS